MTHTMTNLRQALFLALRKHALNAVGAVMIVLMAHLLRKQGITLDDIVIGLIVVLVYVSAAMAVEFYRLRKA
jgi:hypothetical protein